MYKLWNPKYTIDSTRDNENQLYDFYANSSIKQQLSQLSTRLDFAYLKD